MRVDRGPSAFDHSHVLSALFCGSASRKGATFSIDRPEGETGLDESIRTMQKMAPPPSALFCGRPTSRNQRVTPGGMTG